MSAPIAPSWHDAGPADLALSGLQCRIADDTRVLIVRDEAGRYFAVGAECSHALLPLAGGRVRRGAVVCPHHGARFDLRDGRSLGPPAATGIASWPVRLAAGRVEVLL
jgi:3-phenylpropionate/trans-cinnamate dioxygenase ferredoxin subunit